MPAISLRCRSCGHEVGLDGVGACPTVLGPARARVRPRRDPPRTDPRVDRRRPAVALALRRAPAGRDADRAEPPTRPDAARRRRPASPRRSACASSISSWTPRTRRTPSRTGSSPSRARRRRSSGSGRSRAPRPETSRARSPPAPRSRDSTPRCSALPGSSGRSCCRRPRTGRRSTRSSEATTTAAG